MRFLNGCGLLVSLSVLSTGGRIAAADGPTAPGGAVAAAATMESGSVEQLLAARIGEFDFKRITLEKSLAELSRQASVNISIDWKALTAAKIAGDAVLELHLRNVATREILETILRGASRTDERLDYLPRDGMIVVTTETALAGSLIVRVYPCSDLLKGPLSPEQERHLDSAIARLWKEHYAVFGPPWRGLSQREGRPQLGTYRERVDILAELHASLSARRLDQIVSAIYSTVDSAGWRRLEGATIRVVGESLVISQTARNHRVIADLLAQLRAASK